MKIKILFFCLFCFILAGCDNTRQINVKVWYDTPAENWTGELPLGNGRLGAKVFGHPEEEQFQLKVRL